jgi:hypothetical protein
MALFKSKSKRKMERELAIRRAVNHIKKQIASLEQNERGYVDKAKRALQMGSADQLEFLKKTLKKTASQRRLMERQLLNIETAVQIKNQAEAHAGFAKAMTALSRSIGEMFAATDMAKTQRAFESALVKAQTMEEQMDVFLDVSSEAMFGYEPTAASEELVTDAEIERMITGEVVQAEGAGLDAEIEAGLKEVEQELRKDS